MLAHVYIRTYIRTHVHMCACMFATRCVSVSPVRDHVSPLTCRPTSWRALTGLFNLFLLATGSSLGRVKSPADPLAFPACQSYWGSDPNWDDFMRSCLLWSFLDWGWSGAIIVLPRRKRSSALNRGSRGEWFNESNKSSQQGAEIKSWCFRQPCYAYWPHSCH